ncbi:MAG TPA: GldG family protein, partial [Gammaproteobacteria bacterium]|nr:GldG family protein [Gammaproteobacteria bacterium]
MDSRQRLQYRLQSGVFLLLFVGLLAALAWTSSRHAISIDMSANQRNSLAPESARLVAEIEYPLKATLFASPSNDARPLLEALFERYRELQPLISFESLNPDLYPDLLRAHDIRYDGEVLLEYQGRSEKVSQVNEASVSSAIQRLLRRGERWLVFLEGHGERNPYSEANHDFSLFSRQLASSGYTIETLNLTLSTSIPKNTDILVLASPKVPLLPGEIELLVKYIDQGGNLLWLADPEQASDGLELLTDRLGIEFLPGIVVDPNSQLMGLDRADFALVSEYPRHPVTQNLGSLSLFPQAQAITYHGGDDWHQQVLLSSDSRSWNETGSLKGDLLRGDDDDEIQGPLKLALTLSRDREDDADTSEQRVAIVGDADFLANRYLGNGSNLEIGVNLINWLSLDDGLISISPRPAPDTRLELDKIEQLTIAIFFLIFLPLALLGSGL